MAFLPPKEVQSADTVRAMYHDLFTVQERETVADLLFKGKIDFVGAALEVENPERAYWLDLYLALKRPKAEPEDSIVQEEIRKWQGEGNEIDSPEKAAFWDARLKLERDEQKLPDLQVALKSLEVGVADSTSEPVVEKKTHSKAELKAMLDEKGIAYEQGMKKAELQALLGIIEDSSEDEI